MHLGSSVLVRVAGLALAIMVGSGAALASSISYTTTGSSSDGALSASAAFTTAPGQVTVTLTDTLAANLFRSAGQALSDLSFTLSNSPGTLSSATATGQLGNLSGATSNGVGVTYTSGSPTRFLGTHPGNFSISGDTVTLEAIGGGQPSEMLAPFIANGGTYIDGNNGLQNFNPYTIGSATFVLDLSGVTSATQVTGATFSFGTGPDTFLPGTPVPEPSSLVLLGTGILSMGGLIRRYLA